jgi:hypothetical protein
MSRLCKTSVEQYQNYVIQQIEQLSYAIHQVGQYQGYAINPVGQYPEYATHICTVRQHKGHVIHPIR